MPTRVKVFTQSMDALIGKKQDEQFLGQYEYKSVDVTQLYNELYEQWATLQLDGTCFRSCLDEEEKVLSKMGIDLPIEFEVGKHPLKDCSIPELYVDTVDKWLRARDAHIDDYGAYGNFKDGRYALKDEKSCTGSVCIWTKEIYAAVHAARDVGEDVADKEYFPISFVHERGDAVADKEELYKKYMTLSIDKLLQIGL